jgi:hypothetical protein
MKINYRQLSIMVFMSFIALKFLALPSLLYKESENMSWLVALVLMLIDAIYAYLIIELMKRSDEKNIYEFMKKTLGIVLTKIFMFLLMLKLMMNMKKSTLFKVLTSRIFPTQASPVPPIRKKKCLFSSPATFLPNSMRLHVLLSNGKMKVGNSSAATGAAVPEPLLSGRPMPGCSIQDMW